ncbi:MAG TPA: ACP S-malonyltransferase [Solirubrobacteraceae bacterium]|nr:ACP S-malonyltransferase [Solirubrobacteraceae bacterium]
MALQALLFPGQGSHSPGMEEPWRDNPLLRRGVELLSLDPFAALGEGTRTQQPALFLCGVAAWDAAGRPGAAAAAGHSLGEYAALVAAGALEFDDAVRLVDARARAMDEAARARPGGMVACLGGETEAVRSLAGRLGLSVANDNAPGQIVLSGPLEAVERAVEQAKEAAGARARRLDVAGAFHSPLMQPAAAALREALDATRFAAPRFPVFSNGTAAPFGDVRAELAENLLRAVRFRETLLALRAAGVEEYVELGPGRVLSGLVKRTVGARRETGAAA